jgi:hypothetical protein
MPLTKQRQINLVTIGVYGFTESTFFSSLIAAGVDTFCDIRQRRGVRGSLYSFANSSRLQQKLKDLGISYLYWKELAPTDEIRAIQKAYDTNAGVRKQQREELSEGFVSAYEAICLATFEPDAFIEKLGSQAKVIALFCVERKARACHRFLVANKISKAFGIEARHVEP